MHAFCNFNRYTAATIIIGAAYSIFQIVCAIIRLAKRNEGNVMLDFFGEEVRTYVEYKISILNVFVRCQLISSWMLWCVLLFRPLLNE